MSGPPDNRAVSISTAGFEDGLGRRSVRFDREIGGMLECLHLRPELGAFERPLRERTAEIDALDDERFVRVRAIERDPRGLTVVSELVPGERLIDIIEARQKDESNVFGIDAALGFLLQVLPALSVLHAAGITHGTVTAGHIAVTPGSQIVLLDGIYAVALERLQFDRRALWTSFGVMAPQSAGAARFDRRADIGQAVMCALVLVSGRPVGGAGDPATLLPLVTEVSELAEIRAGGAFSQDIKRFFETTLPLHDRRPAVAIDDATAAVRRLSSVIGESVSYAAFAELARADGQARQGRGEAAGTGGMPPPATARPMAPVVREPDAPVSAAQVSPAAIERPAPVAAPPTVIERPAPLAPPAAETIAPRAAPPAEAPPLLATPGPFTPVPVEPTPPRPLEAIAPAVQGPPAPDIAPVSAMPTPIALKPVQVAAPAPLAVPNVTAPRPSPIGIAPGPPAPVRVRSEAPAGYQPPRHDPNAAARALPFVNRGQDTTPARFPWKLAVAAIVVMTIAVVAGRVYLVPSSGPQPVSVVPAPAAVPAAPAAVTTGSLSIDSQPSGARINLDGADAGVTPLKLEGIAPGRHTLVISTESATVRRTIRIDAGKQLALDVPVYSGWISVFSPIPLDVSSGGRTLGSSETGKIMLPPGRHTLTLSSTDFGFSETRTVEIFPGEERPLNIDPKGRVNVNAYPWAEVWVDGVKAGETPLANLSLPLGTRVFVFKHPQYGERRLTVTITSTSTPISVDFTRPPGTP